MSGISAVASPHSPPVAMLKLCLLAASVATASAAGEMICSHSHTGTCDAGGLFGFCSANVKTGEFGCDEAKKCVAKKSQLLKIGKSGGCFSNGLCCCNAGAFCNNVFLTNNGLKDTQECHAGDILAVGEIAKPRCKDPWCYTIELKSGGRRSRMNGCQQKFFEQLQMTPDEHGVKEFKGATLPPCAELWNSTRSRRRRDDAAAAQPTPDRVCQNIKFTNAAGEAQEGWQCCCRGKEKCNQNLQPSQTDFDTMSLFGEGGGAAAAALHSILLSLGLVALALSC